MSRSMAQKRCFRKRSCRPFSRIGEYPASRCPNPQPASSRRSREREAPAESDRLPDSANLHPCADSTRPDNPCSVLDNPYIDGSSVADVTEAAVTARLPILILLLLSLALGPSRFAAACKPSATAHSCHHCCASLGRSCCAAPCNSAPQEKPASVAPQSQDAKQMVSPHFVFIAASFQPAMVLASTHKRQAARTPGRARIAVTCIRLI